MTATTPIELEFSKKYTDEHALQYFQKHRAGAARRLSHWRDESIARKALAAAGEPRSVLDLPCGAGRFWPLLAKDAERELYAADNSDAMLETAQLLQPASVTARVRSFQSSAFAIQAPAEFVDCVFCIRLLHHIKHTDQRLALLRELHRVSRDTVIISLWVDGNVKSWQRARLEKRRAARGGTENNNRFVLARAQAESEFTAAGFSVVQYFDFLPGWAMWRTYVLRKVVGGSL